MIGICIRTLCVPYFKRHTCIIICQTTECLLLLPPCIALATIILWFFVSTCGSSLCMRDNHTCQATECLNLQQLPSCVVLPLRKQLASMASLSSADRLVLQVPCHVFSPSRLTHHFPNSCRRRCCCCSQCHILICAWHTCCVGEH